MVATTRSDLLRYTLYTLHRSEYLLARLYKNAPFLSVGNPTRPDLFIRGCDSAILKINLCQATGTFPIGYFADLARSCNARVVSGVCLRKSVSNLFSTLYLVHQPEKRRDVNIHNLSFPDSPNCSTVLHHITLAGPLRSISILPVGPDPTRPRGA